MTRGFEIGGISRKVRWVGDVRVLLGPFCHPYEEDYNYIENYQSALESSGLLMRALSQPDLTRRSGRLR